LCLFDDSEGFFGRVFLARQKFEIVKRTLLETNPNWKMPDDMTWHHHEDGVTMLLIPQTVNKVPHTGGAALSKVPGY
jgi:A nuclease of the HNH/ENDO VII superfamily with conserved WHH